jgi:quercetin dioxygenase-like cupin family protein
MPEVAKLAESVEYQPGSIVSKQLIGKSTGTLTLFAFDQGQSLSEHTAPFDAFVQVLDGQGLITISGVDHTVKTGEMIIMPAGQPHAVRAVEKFKMMLVMIRG